MPVPLAENSRTVALVKVTCTVNQAGLDGRPGDALNISGGIIPAGRPAGAGFPPASVALLPVLHDA